MKKLFAAALLLSLFLAEAQENNLARLDSFLTYLEDHDKMMGSLSVFENGKEVYQRSLGHANVEAKVHADAGTIYRIGSISKTFTAAIVMQMIGEKKLSLDDKLSEYYPEIPNAEDITIEHLLRHQSGLFNFTNAEDFPNWMTEPTTKQELLAIFKENGSDFMPGEKTEYSNTNYVLLTYIAEDVAAKPYGEILKTRITDKLGLENTFYRSAGEKAELEAKSYVALGGWQPGPVSHMSTPAGAGAILSTATELNEFYTALFRQKVVSPNALEQMKKMQMGMWEDDFEGRTGYGHGGAIDAFKSSATYFPEPKVAIAFVSNGAQLRLDEFLDGVGSIYFGEEYEFPEFAPTVEVETDELEKLVGVYKSPDFPLDVEITHKEGKLIGQATGQPAFPLDATDSRNFRFDPAGLTLEFVPEENKMLLTQGGQTATLRRE